MRANYLFKKFQIYIGIFLGLISAMSSVYIAHKTFFLSDVRAEFDKVYVSKKDIDLIAKDIKVVDDKIDSVEVMMQEVRGDVKFILKERL